ncbi:uncharacterized protein LOC134929213 isoform X1 [Pseudophryne corroboree]|uniref:uncharacterized protein LOC134929213 isoform X1 n=2 Tax=Pseudophryne corroboree TaxID=495146 RepID=UPI0030813AF7
MQINLPNRVRKRASTARTQTTLPRGADAGDAGTSSSHHPPLRRPSQGSASLQKMVSKRRHLEAVSTPASSPPQRRISTVLAQPPEAILASPQSEETQSPQLSDPDIMPQDTQQETDLQQMFTHHLQAIDNNQPTTPADITQPPQTTHTPQLSPTPPQPQMGPEFWSSWATQQAQNYACLNTHSQYLASLPHHLPRLSRNSGRLIVQLGRVTNTMEQMRADNSQLIASFQRIMDEQHRHQQAPIQIIQNNQLITESLSRIIANNTAATTQLTASLNNLSQNINVLASQQQSSSSGTTTPSQTPVTSPVRRSSRTRPNVPSQSSAPSKKTPRK